MALDRDAIFEALRKRLAGIAGVANVTDTMRPWSQVTPGEQPYLCLVKGPETPENVHKGMPPKWRLTARLYVYTHSASRADMSATRQQNRLLTEIEGILERQPGEGDGGPEPWATTLGGLVSHAWIEGPVEVDQGTLGDQSVAIIAVEMLATG